MTARRPALRRTRPVTRREQLEAVRASLAAPLLDRTLVAALVDGALPHPRRDHAHRGRRDVRVTVWQPVLLGRPADRGSCASSGACGARCSGFRPARRTAGSFSVRGPKSIPETGRASASSPDGAWPQPVGLLRVPVQRRLLLGNNTRNVMTSQSGPEQPRARPGGSHEGLARSDESPKRAEAVAICPGMMCRRMGDLLGTKHCLKSALGR